MPNVRYCVDLFFFFRQNTAYEMRISDWSSDVCSSDLEAAACRRIGVAVHILQRFDIAEDRREGGTQLVARIGDEIRSHPVGGVDRRMVRKHDDALSVLQRRDATRPTLAGPRQVDEITSFKRTVCMGRTEGGGRG